MKEDFLSPPCIMTRLIKDMDLDDRIQCLVTLEESGNIIRVIKFFINPKMLSSKISPRTYRQKFGNITYTLTLFRGKDHINDPEERKDTHITINSFEKFDFNEEKFTDFLNLVIPENMIKLRVKEDITSFLCMNI